MTEKEMEEIADKANYEYQWFCDACKENIIKAIHTRHQAELDDLRTKYLQREIELGENNA